MKNITPCFWFNKESKETAELYVRVFKGPRILHASTLEGTPLGIADMVQMEIFGQEIHSMSVGSHF